MSISRMRKRLSALEEAGNWARIGKLPPLTSSEIAEIDQRARAGKTLSKLELARVERQSPILDGELMMTAYGGRLFIKRYLGIDLAMV